MQYRLKAIDTCLVGKTFDEPKESDFPEVCFKYADIEHVLKNTTDYVREVIRSCPLRNDHKYVVVDVKVHELNTGEIPALSFWHMDCLNNPINPNPEEFHHIFVSGDECLTEFLAQEMEVDLPEGAVNFNDVVGDASTAKITGNTIYTYQRHVHRASQSQGQFRRLLVRVSESDIVKPQRKPFTVTYTRRKHVS